MKTVLRQDTQSTLVLSTQPETGTQVARTRTTMNQCPSRIEQSLCDVVVAVVVGSRFEICNLYCTQLVLGVRCAHDPAVI
jgi:hypothetical protein